MPDYRVESCVVSQAQDVEQAWTELQKRADCSYFQSWGWIGTWLEQIAVELQPVAVSVWRHQELVGLGLFVSRDISRRMLFHARAMYLNEYPFDGRNMVIEFNGLLSAQGHEHAVYQETIAHLLMNYQSDDEFCFGAMLEQSADFITENAFAEDVNYIVSETSVSRSVALNEIPRGIDNYLSSLSRNRRGQVRRALKIYDADGSLQLEEAVNIDQALLYFDRLKTLHTEYWRSKEKQGSFANPRWQAFHLALINNRFEAGEIQLLKISSSVGEIGYLYNLVLDKHVYVMQSGFKRSDDKRLMPGYVAHTLAITHNRSKGMDVYDLMHGDTLYKQLLCNRKQTLVWLTLQRKKLKFKVENAVVGIVRFLRRGKG